MGDTSAAGQRRAANVQHSAASDGKAPRTRARRADPAQDPRRGAGGVRRERLFGRLDRRDHQPRHGRAGHILHLFRQQGGGVPGAGPRHVGAGPRPCRARRSRAPPTGSKRERRALASFLDFVASHKEVYRIIDEAEFVDPEGFRTHYVTTAERIAARLRAGTRAAARSRRRIADRRRGPGLGDHGHERLPRAALRRVGQGGSRGGRRKSPTGCCATDCSASRARAPASRSARYRLRHDRGRGRCAARRRAHR